MTKDIWQQKSDEELVIASEHLLEYTPEAEETIRAELRRRNMPEPGSTIRPTEGETSNRSNLPSTQSVLRSGILIPIGIVIVVVGVALIIISPNLLWQEVSFRNPGLTRTTDLRSLALLFGVALLAVGGVVSAVGLMQFISSQTASRVPPTTEPTVASPVSTRSVALGNTIDEAQSVMGQPEKIIDLGARVIHVYEDMKIIYVNGTVSDVQLS